MTQPIGLGLIGTGGFGAFTLQAYAQMPEVRLVAASSTNAERRRELQQRYNATAYEQPEALLADERVELVVINTPPWLHYPQALLAIEAGKHVFIEKPLATETAHGAHLVRAAEQRGVRLSVNYVMRHAPLYHTLKALLASNLFGQITYLSLENNASNEVLGRHHWFWQREQSGGIFVEHGVHFFDIASYLLASAPEHVAAQAHTSADGREDRVQASVRYANGVLACFYHAFDRPGVLERTTMRITLERGAVQLHGWVPDRLELEGTLPAKKHGELEQLLGVRLQLADAKHGLVRATIRRPDRTADYLAASSAGLADLAQAIRNPAHLLTVTPQAALESLRLAATARSAADHAQTLAIA